LFDVGSNVNRLQLAQLGNAVILAPLKKRAGSTTVSGPRIRVADINGKEFEEAQRSFLTSSLNQCRHWRFRRDCCRA